MSANTIMKHCSKCGLDKPLSDFDKDKNRPDGHYPSCRQCRHEWYWKDGHGKELAKRRYWRNPEKCRNETHQFLIDHPGKAKEYRDRHYQKCHAKCLQVNANLRQKYTYDAFMAYGGTICACCGETNPKFLTIDHINGCTRSERKEQRTGWLFHQWLKKHGYPPGYQVLCYNCNLGRARNNGICPHKITITV